MWVSRPRSQTPKVSFSHLLLRWSDCLVVQSLQLIDPVRRDHLGTVLHGAPVCLWALLESCVGEFQLTEYVHYFARGREGRHCQWSQNTGSCCEIVTFWWDFGTASKVVCMDVKKASESWFCCDRLVPIVQGEQRVTSVVVNSTVVLVEIALTQGDLNISLAQYFSMLCLFPSTFKKQTAANHKVCDAYSKKKTERKKFRNLWWTLSLSDHLPINTMLGPVRHLP